MGFFSKTCSCCGYSITNDCVKFSTEEISEAFRTVVWLTPEFTVIGTYSGYGSIYNTNTDIDVEDYYDDTENPFMSVDGVLMHRFCWEKIGSPSWNSDMPQAGWAADQGYFITDDKEYEDYYLGKGKKRSEVSSWNVSNQRLNLYSENLNEKI